MMSRIPAPGLRTTKQDENKQFGFKKPAVLVSKAGLKRPGDSQVALSEKKQKVNFGAPLKRNFAATENLHPVTKSAGFSEKAKRAALHPISESALMRGSMPALNIASARSKTKRPAWDLKGRIQDMEEHFQKSSERIAALEATNTMLSKDVEIKSTQSEEASSKVAELDKALRERTEEVENHLQEISKLKEENRNLKNKLTSLKRDYESLQSTYQQETSSLKSSITSLTCSKSGLQSELDATGALVESLKIEVKQLSKMNFNKEQECNSLSRSVAELKLKLMEEEAIKRKMHNTIQELKGNIRVYCRIRPALHDELKNGMQLANILTPTSKMIEIHQAVDSGINDSNGKMQKKFEFSFDSVFSSSASQEIIFEEISQLVQSSIDGYNVCIFAYGQTGSGKTYTMEGPESIIDFAAFENESHLGMIPRSVQQIFKCIDRLEPRGWKYKVEALFLEIYNERIQDLLTTDAQNGNAKCEIIKSAGKGNDCLLSNVTASPVICAEEVFNLLKKARINRAVAATKCNEHSSRSHYVFQLKIFGENISTGEKSEGILNLVDLAGSERVKESGSAGDRLTEAKAINKSLSNLGKVIMSLSKKENHIPYRDSKLTHLLANSLGGNSKTLMFVNISPDQENINETVNSLRFATKVNQCNIGTAQKRVK